MSGQTETHLPIHGNVSDDLCLEIIIIFGVHTLPGCFAILHAIAKILWSA